LQFTTAAREKLWNVTGVDVRAVAAYRKFNFLAQIGSRQKAVYDLHGYEYPWGVGMDILFRGQLAKIHTVT